jgi:glycerol kinase
MLAGVGCGLFGSLREAAAAVRGPIDRFIPAPDKGGRARRIEQWDRAVAGVRANA